MYFKNVSYIEGFVMFYSEKLVKTLNIGMIFVSKNILNIFKVYFP